MKTDSRSAGGSRAVQTVLYIYEGGYLTCRRRLAGIYKVTTPRGIRVVLMDVHAGADIGQMLDFWKPDGIVAEGDAVRTGWLRRFARRKIPTVLCGPAAGADACWCHRIQHDSRTTARMAVRELLSLGYAAYGCVEYWTACEWSDRRIEEFSESLGRAGCRGEVFRSSVECRQGDFRDFLAHVSAFLRRLPKPCGIFAVNDEMALNVLAAAQREGYDVPNEVAIVGIDNDELLCDNASVSLTSIAPDFEKSGMMAVELLLKSAANPRLPPANLTYGAAPLVRRRSTSVFKVRMHGVLEALDAIRTRYAAPEFDVDAVVALMGCSRRSAETRFLKSTGETIGSAIRNRRLAAAEQMLLDERRSIAAVAAGCGFADVGTFQKAFIRARGMSPSAWRAAQRRAQRCAN